MTIINAWQWDTDIPVRIPYAGTTAPELDFMPDTGTGQTVRPELSDGTLTAQCPPQLLKSSRPIQIYARQGNTIDRVGMICIRPRPKPPDYIDTPEAVRTWEELAERITKLEEDDASGGTVTDEQIAAAVDAYMQEKPVITALEKRVTDLEKIVKALQESIGSVVAYGKLILSSTEVAIGDVLSATFTVKLGNAPTEEQTVTLASDNEILTVAPASIVFTSENYGVEQEITVSIAEPSSEAITANVTVSTNDDTAVVSVNITESESVIEWYTVQESDATIANYTTLDKVYTVGSVGSLTEPNILFPNISSGNYQVAWNGFNTTATKNIKYEEGAAVSDLIGSSEVLERIIDIPHTVRSIDLACPNLRYISDVDESVILKTCKITGSGKLKKLPRLNADCKVTQLVFSNNTALEDESDFVIPNNVTQMFRAFSGCVSLKKPPHIRNNKVTQWNESFAGTAIEEIYVEADDFDQVYTTYGLLCSGALPNNAFNLYCNLSSAIFPLVRDYVHSSANSENLYKYRLRPIDESEIMNGIVFWGDSLCHFGNENNGKMPTHFLEQMASNVTVYNLSTWGRKAISDAAQTYFDARSVFYGDVTVIWMGTNDVNGGNDATIVADEIKTRYVDKLTTDKYIVLNPWTGSTATAAFAEKFGGHFFDERQYIFDNWGSITEITGLTPTDEDNAAVAAGAIPPSLLQSDKLHLNDYSGKIIARGIKEKLLELGYIDSTWLA